jgi:hypothetical protein
LNSLGRLTINNTFNGMYLLGAHAQYAVGVGSGRRAGEKAAGSRPERGAWAASQIIGCSAETGPTQPGEARGYAMHAWSGAVHTGSAQQGCAAHVCAVHGGHTGEGVGAMGQAWLRVQLSRIGGVSPGSERWGRDSQQRNGGAGGGYCMHTAYSMA